MVQKEVIATVKKSEMLVIDKRYKAFYVIENGVHHHHGGFFGSYDEPFSGMLCSLCRQASCKGEIEDCFAECVTISSNGSVEFNPDITIKNEGCTIRKATKAEIKEFTATLAKFNLAIKGFESTHKRYDVYERKTEYSLLRTNHLTFKNKEKILFKFKGELITLEELKKINLGEDKTFHFFYDNGYSYMGN